MRTIRSGVCWAGLAAGPLAWAGSLQFDYSAAHWQCLSGQPLSLLISLAGILFGMVGSLLSWRALSDERHGMAPPLTLRTRRFVARTSLGIGAIFIRAMMLQVAAGLIFTGCEL
jgi:hypothetical protein